MLEGTDAVKIPPNEQFPKTRLLGSWPHRIMLRPGSSSEPLPDAENRTGWPRPHDKARHPPFREWCPTLSLVMYLVAA